MQIIFWYTLINWYIDFEKFEPNEWSIYLFLHPLCQKETFSGDTPHGFPAGTADVVTINVNTKITDGFILKC